MFSLDICENSASPLGGFEQLGSIGGDQRLELALECANLARALLDPPYVEAGLYARGCSVIRPKPSKPWGSRRRTLTLTPEPAGY
jgi:hypothetical protein